MFRSQILTVSCQWHDSQKENGHSFVYLSVCVSGTRVDLHEVVPSHWVSLPGDKREYISYDTCLPDWCNYIEKTEILNHLASFQTLIILVWCPSVAASALHSFLLPLACSLSCKREFFRRVFKNQILCHLVFLDFLNVNMFELVFHL